MLHLPRAQLTPPMFNIPWLPNADVMEFPSVNHALIEPDGLLAIGGNLSPSTLMTAYENGIFPWFEDNQPILWWSPSERAVIKTNEIHISKNMRKLINRKIYRVTADTDFDAVIQACAAVSPNRQSTWITQQMQQAYKTLFNAGVAHSIEVYNEQEQLVGGLYGVFVNNCFCGESMFSQKENTSKLALIALANFLNAHDCPQIDCQLPTTHLSSMGATCIYREHFIDTLQSTYPNTRLTQQHWTNLWQP